MGNRCFQIKTSSLIFASPAQSRLSITSIMLVALIPFLVRIQQIFQTKSLWFSSLSILLIFISVRSHIKQQTNQPWNNIRAYSWNYCDYILSGIYISYGFSKVYTNPSYLLEHTEWCEAICIVLQWWNFYLVPVKDKYEGLIKWIRQKLGKQGIVYLEINEI